MMEKTLHVIVGNKKTGEVKWVRYHLEDVDEDEIYIDQHPGSVPEFPELPHCIKNEELNTAHEDPAAPHRIWMAVIDEALVPEATEAVQDAIKRCLEFDIAEIKETLGRLQRQREAGVELAEAMPLRWNTGE